MSGFKRATVTISEEEYRRLHETDMKRKFRQHSRRQANAEHLTELNSILEQMRQRQHQLQEILGGSNLDADPIGIEMVQETLEQNERCYRGLEMFIEEMAFADDDSLGQGIQLFRQRIQREIDEYCLSLHSVSQRLGMYEQREQFKVEATRKWLRHSVILADFIQVQFDHERFLPGKLSIILGSLRIAQNNLAQGFFEASLQMSQQAYIELSELHFELERRVLEWQAEYQRTQNAINQAINELKLNSQVKALGLEGEELAEQVDLAYWTDGKYQQFLEKVRRFSALLEQERPQITAEELRKISEEFPETITTSLESYIYEARLKALNSQLRMNIAETALQALEQHGFTLNDSGYANQDMRAPFMVNLESTDGTRVRIQVTPTEKGEQELANELVVITNHPYLKTEHEARLQWDELCRSLNESDLQVSHPEIRVAPPVTMPKPINEAPILVEPSVVIKKKDHV